MIIAAVGSGGKTTLIKMLADKYHSEGKSVLITTTTHMFIEEETLLDASAEEIIERLHTDGIVMAGTRAAEDPLRKMAALPPDVYEAACRHADVILVEADGSRGLPLKYPAPSEPVSPKNADEIIVVCGLSALGHPAQDVCHRLELVKECLDIQSDTIITAEHIQKLVREGYLEPLREKYPDAAVRLHVTHDKTLYQRTIASLLEMEQNLSFLKKEWFSPQPVLIICGGGHVSKEVAAFASGLDFYVKVMDDRQDLVTKERFPTADELICDSFDNLSRYMEPDAYYVVVTPNHKADYTCVRTILPSAYRYLGMIGSRTKVANTRQLLMDEGFQPEQIDSVYAPIGLTIGAVTPAEIAISILAQVIQVKNTAHAASADLELLTAQDPGILCIITEKHGSAPRGTGSMMLVGKERILGSIGGGQAEYMAIERARSMTGFDVESYDLRVNAAEDPGMICGGIIKVIFIPLC